MHSEKTEFQHEETANLENFSGAYIAPVSPKSISSLWSWTKILCMHLLIYMMCTPHSKIFHSKTPLKQSPTGHENLAILVGWLNMDQIS